MVNTDVYTIEDDLGIYCTFIGYMYQSCEDRIIYKKHSNMEFIQSKRVKVKHHGGGDINKSDLMRSEVCIALK